MFAPRLIVVTVQPRGIAADPDAEAEITAQQNSFGTQSGHRLIRKRCIGVGTVA